ncbi:mycofactocin-coupled SDR family oxidoreductase [Rhodococcus globerulus]|uniref:Mycofactocin-coupled SDR family oxidoreductase n=1 Tax=Rhodococcus globerulus TaxID=33008 RepID=A0ABU4C3S1_RHOGO|nr:mycofactocin-coupled SDR family oxidoreductase [Rhodococcus globerulus]MDV6270863.1 mycofactocin-coupled SDR family oxidoreductase [Rhodococcus globerulus]
MAGKLEGKVALISGAARGQGRSHAIALAGEGANIIAIDACDQIETVPYAMPTVAELESTAEAVELAGGKIIYDVVDVRDLSGLRKFVDSAVLELGRLDIVCANAGISTFSSILDMDEQMWDTTIEINLTGVWKTCKAALPHIINGESGGSIIITSSSATSMISENIGHYIASKHGLIGLSRTLAKELARHRIRVNTVHPTGVATPMILNEPVYQLFRPDLENPNRNDFEDAAKTLHPLGVPFVEPEDVSDMIVYLASNSSRYITGSSFMLDAGGSLR